MAVTYILQSMYIRDYSAFFSSYPVKSCPRLRVVELDHMCEIGEEDARKLCGVGLKGLEELDFTFTPVTPKAILHFISEWVNLHCIEKN